MADDDDAVHAQKRRAADFGEIRRALQFIEGPFRHQSSQLPNQFGHDRLFHKTAHGFRQLFATLQDHVADKSVANRDIDAAREQIMAFHVADEIDHLGFMQQRQRSLRQLVALSFFRAVANQSDARIRLVQNRFRVNRSHDAVVQKIHGSAIHARARIQQHEIAALGWHNRRNARPFDTGQHR